MITDDIKVVKQEYNDIKQSDNITQTYDYFDPTKPNTSNYQGSTIKTSSQSEIDALWTKAWTKAQTINSQKYDYEPLTQNCNTTTYVMAREMGLVSQVESFLNQKKVWTPGFGKNFEHSLIDKGWDFLTEFPTNFKNDITIIKDWLDDFKNSRKFEGNNSLKINFDKKYTLSLKPGNKLKQLEDSGIIKSGNLPDLKNSIITLKDNNGNEFSFIKDVLVPLKDDTLATLTTIIDTITSAQSHLSEFLFSQLPVLGGSFQKYLVKNKDRMIGELIAKLILGESLQEAMKQVAEVWGTNALLSNEVTKEALSKLLADFGVKNSDVNTSLQAGIVVFLSSVLISNLRNDDMNGANSWRVSTGGNETSC
jgi:hypothetical protein